MNEGSLPLPGHNEQHDAVERYEAMLDRSSAKQVSIRAWAD